MSNMRVLYVDEEEDLVKLASLFFQEESLPIDTSTSFEKALRMISMKDYDLVIYDLRAAVGAGRDFIEKIKTQGKFKGKLLLLTGNLDLDEDKDLYDEIAYKPIRFLELVEKVRRMLIST